MSTTQPTVAKAVLDALSETIVTAGAIRGEAVRRTGLNESDTDWIYAYDAWNVPLVYE